MTAGSRTRRPLGPFEPTALATALRAMQPAGAGATPAESTVPSRRRFLQAGAAGAMAVGLPLLGACGGGDDVRPAAQPAPTETATEGLTLFFDYSHLDTAGKSMWVQVGQKNIRLRPVADAPDVLGRERAGNRFLAAVDDRYITHVAEGVPAPTPGYVGFHQGITDGANGEWTLDTVGLLLPPSSSVVAFERARQQLGGASLVLPVSAKRRKYGLPAAVSASDLHEEQSLQGTVSHAATLLVMQKDTMALDADAAATVIHSHVMPSNAVFNLEFAVGPLGTASPEKDAGVLNKTGWATLRPLRDGKGNLQRINQPGDPANGRIVYMPVFNPDIASTVGAGVGEVLPKMQDDATLGADVTGSPADASLRGTLWVRRDGQPTIVPGTSAAQASGAAVCSIDWPDGSNQWLDCTASTSAIGSGQQQLDVQFSNIGLRYLSCFVEFYDEAGNLIPLGTLPGWSDNSWLSAPINFTYDAGAQQNDTRLFLGPIASIGTIMGIPVYTDSFFFGSLELKCKLSENVQRVRFYSGGLGVGSNNYPDTIAGGVAATMFVNYILTIVLGVLGAVKDLETFIALVADAGATLMSAVAAAVTDDFGTSTGTPKGAQFFEDQGANLLNFFLGAITGSSEPILKAIGERFVLDIGEDVAESAFMKAIPFVGIALNIESAVVAAADFILTTVAIAQSPFTYVTDVSLTHDLAVTVLHDRGNSVYPRAANVMTVIVTLDDGKPQRQDVPLDTAHAPKYPNEVPQVTFANVKYGGKLQIDVQFNQRPLDGTTGDNILLGTGSTGRVDNADAGSYTITIVEKPFPVGANTKYVHDRRSYLDGAGKHVWVVEAAPTTLPTEFACGSAGEVCEFNGITVRQGTDSAATMLGYAWRGQNLAGGGDVGQQAVMNADDPGLGYAIATNPQAVAGLDIAFSRYAGGSANFYVDPSGARPMVRGIRLDTGGNPSFDGPGSNLAFGALNLSSDALLQHPSGCLISISGANNRFEILNPPAQPVSDAVASKQHVAQVVGKTGILPGRISGVVAATITQDGTLLLLENTNNRVQAFDLGGSNPVRYFQNAPTPYFLPLNELPTGAGWRHLDIQADFSGLLYVLSKNTRTGAYRLSIYDKLTATQAALSFTEAIYAARIGLDHFRDLYTLNYQPISVQGGSTPPAITEPSVSLWLPQRA